MFENHKHKIMGVNCGYKLSKLFMCYRVFEVLSMPLKIPFPMIITGFMSRMHCLEVQVVSKIVVGFAWLTKEKIDNMLRF